MRTQPVNDEAKEPTLIDIAARLDDLTRELRRQGRAAIAAQAAAESCLHALANHGTAGDATQDATAAIGWLKALLPVADALDRVVVHASALVDRHARRGRLYRWFFAGETRSSSDLHFLVEGLRLLRAQLEMALAELGVTIDRRVGIPLDPTLHRVVEVRHQKAHAAGLVIEVVRPGYALGEQVVREAEVVSSAQGAPAELG
jgi:molecular chaperone GrpE